MNQDMSSPLRASRTRLSTGLKMFLLLSLGLLPLGLLAIIATIQSAREDSERRTDQTLARLSVKAQRIDSLLARTAATIRASSAAIALTPANSGVCEQTLQRLRTTQRTQGNYALFADGVLRCATPGFAAVLPEAAPGQRSLLAISEDGEQLRFAFFEEDGQIEGMGSLDRASLAELTYLPGYPGPFDLQLRQGDRIMLLNDAFEAGPFTQVVRGTEPVAAGRLELDIALSGVPIRPFEALMILLPVMMWIVAAIVGWAIVNRFLLKPLERMQRAVAAYQPGDQQLALPALATPAREIEELGMAFDQVTRTVARHEAELEAAVERQSRLVREVHHRVKNNLQVVASLLNLHARGADNEEVAAAYASIQRRVDALAVVHRNHYAELEENRGVSLRSLISELGANLRATAPASASSMQIRLDVEPFYATQDVAVSVAFLITELVEYAMFCGAAAISISLQAERDGFARLTVESPSLGGERALQSERETRLQERFERIVVGLARQLRSSLERDPEHGRYSLPIAVVGRGDH